ncbi:hypothetical protein A1O7_10014 [Cladophialophora yegresii CBS 114405]|uniref:Uncharacterized protein n=1 Tax=Cladophialophora yegresii CBS 114405 TaxID=1182544 RepID=W9VGQ6_9EURO|nr:uncharacterized protein A1O7_10014 [Cladophialophora yegresii CBS 114405]EXJ54673.1 hypothetical protein A1O7_10014 [Cladophialophora yegresii CBS 114405]
MAARRRSDRLSVDQSSLLTFSDLTSEASKEIGNRASTNPDCALFLVPVSGPSYTSTRTWKSQAVKDSEEYERMRQRVRHFAPEQFKPNAKLGRGPSEIFPQNVAEWITHKKEMLTIAETETKKNCDVLKAQIEAQKKVPKQQRKIKSVFGEGGKVFNDGLSPVLCLPTIWSAECSQKPTNWPSKAELQWNGDSRRCSLARTKCGRYLPPPRNSTNLSAPFQEQPFQKPHALDETGPVFQCGPSPAESYHGNLNMNNDPGFEAAGAFYLGTELIKEIGEWKPSFVPERREEQLASTADAMVIYDEDGMFGTPDVGEASWNEDSMLSNTWEQQQVWY